jgi:hypothetical protein
MEALPSDNALNIADTALALVGSTRFRRRYMPVRQPDALFGWSIRDVANDGDDSCASFASYILTTNNLIGRTRSTVDTMIQSMERRGWQPAIEAHIGSVAVWPCREDIIADNPNAGHAGIYVGSDTYVSHSSYVRMPVEHGAELRDGRLPVVHYTHENLFR